MIDQTHTEECHSGACVCVVILMIPRGPTKAYEKGLPVPTVMPPCDTANPEDIYIKAPVYHGSPVDKKGSLVYTDFGMDLIPRLEKMGMHTTWKGIEYNLTFISKKVRQNSLQ